MRSILLNAMLTVASLSVGVATFEGVLRLAYPLGSTVYQADEHVLYRLIRGGRRLFTPLPGNGRSVVVKVDRRGFRGDGFSEPRRGPRVAVYGDSFVAAEFSPLHETFVARLQFELRARAGLPGLEVVNAGIAGYGPDQAAFRIEEDLETLAPDLVVLCVFSGNDFGDLLRNKLFRIDDEGELIENNPVLGPELKNAFADAQRTARQPTLIRILNTAWAMRHAPPLPTTFPNYIDDALAARSKEFDDYVARPRVVDNVFGDGFDADLALDPNQPSARLKRALMAGVLARVDRSLRGYDVPWLLVVIPDPVDVAALDFELHVDESKYPSYDRRRLTRAVTGAAQPLGVSYVDLFEPLSETGTARLFFRHGDNHWNAAGQAKSAAVVADAIGAGGFFRPAPPALSASR